MKRTTALGFLALLGLVLSASAIGTPQASAQQPQCLHDQNEQPDQAARRKQALGFTRHVNNLQAAAFPSNKAYQPAERLVLGQSLPEGFVLRLTASDRTYSFSVVDTTDPCRFGYFSDNAGMIFRGEALR